MDDQMRDKILAFMMKAKTDANLKMENPLEASSKPHYEFSVDDEYFLRVKRHQSSQCASYRVTLKNPLKATLEEIIE